MTGGGSDLSISNETGMAGMAHSNCSRLELRRNFFSQRVVSHWNKLPTHVVEADTVNSFKNRLYKEWGI